MLVGFSGNDDAGVYRISSDLAIVQTVDFFTPIVDDAYDFGRIAATNALSDIYAMGARPLTALNIAAFPTDDVDLDVLARILEGGAEVCARAGVAVLGGHTIKDDEPKFGLAVTGTINPENLVRNAGARPGDILLLTKPLGTGILTTARKRDAITLAQLQPAIDAMLTLNDVASRAMVEVGVNAATDITGFGLLGHAGEMMRASAVRLEIDARAVPLFAGAFDLARRDIVPGGTRDNAIAHATFTTFEDGVEHALRLLLSDAQTSGGLLIALAPDRAERLRATTNAIQIGRVVAGSGIHVG